MATKAVKTTKQKEMSANNYIALMVVLGVLALLAGGFFGYQLVKENIRNTKVVAGKLKAKSDLDTKITNANALVENYNGLSSQQKQLIDSAMPNTADLPQLVDLLENVGTSASVSVKAVTLTNGAAAAPSSGSVSSVQTADFDSNVEGSYSAITKFFSNLEASARPMNVESFELRGNSANLTGNITIQTFYQSKADLSDKQETVK